MFKKKFRAIYFKTFRSVEYPSKKVSIEWHWNNNNELARHWKELFPNRDNVSRGQIHELKKCLKQSQLI